MVKNTRAFYAGIALLGGPAAATLFWILIRRSGFSTNYSRCSYLVSTSEYDQLLESGSFPSNPYLPPHLRLDKLSYLDLPETEIALPPMLDLSITQRAQVQQLQDVLPRSERTDTKHQFGPLSSHLIVMTSRSTERYVRRRMGLSDEDRAKHTEEERREATQAVK